MTYLDTKIIIHLAQKTGIALLIAKKVVILADYLDYANAFSKKLVAKLAKKIYINKYSIDLELDK